MAIQSHQSRTTDPLRVGRFPADFIWGVATAAYQVEGAVAEGGRGPSIWDTFSHTPGRTHRGDTGDVACDHYHRWEEDLDLLAELGVPSYRLSFSWSRLQPSGSGPLNMEAVDFYHGLIQGLLERGIRPFVTLYHWDLPQVLEDRGGWPVRETAYLFAAYAKLVVTEFHGEVSDWITINEPWCVAFLGYGLGAHAPGRTDLHDAVAAGHHLNLAHGLALACIREIDPGLQAGITNIVTDIVPLTASPEDRAAAARLDAANNKFFLDPVFAGSYSADVHAIFDGFGLSAVIQPGDLELISAPADFAGVNHYQRVITWHDDEGGYLSLGERPAQPATTSFGWSVLPESLSNVLVRVSRDYTKLPLYVTENGASYEDYVDPNGDVLDFERIDYLGGYLDAAAKAISKGVNLKGYFAWSFLDNYEWAEGYSKRFGLVFVDYGTQARIPKASAHWYGSLIREHRETNAALNAATKR